MGTVPKFTMSSARTFIASLLATLLLATLLIESALVIGAPPAQALQVDTVVINELVAANDSYFDNFGDTPDWIELQNNGATTVDLGGWSIADNGGPWILPSVSIGSGDRLLIFASGRDQTAPQLHTDFSLKRSGETVTLANPDGVLVDSITYPELDDDASYGRGSGGGIGVLVAATPLGANTALAPTTVSITTPPQSFVGTLSIEMSAATAAGEQVRYTTNGNPVTASSPAYAGPFTINNAVVVRAAVVGNGAVGPESSAAYLAIHESISNFSSDLPVVLVRTTSEIGDTDQAAIVSVIDRPDNGRTTVFDEADYTGFAGLRIRGASSAFFPKKQFKFEVWSDPAGNEINANLLGLGRESDWGLYAPGRYDRAMINNPLMYELAKRTGVLAPDYQFVEVYLEDNPNSAIGNSDYLGLYVLRESIKIDDERVDVVKHTPTSAGPDGGYILRYDWWDSCCANIKRTIFGSRVSIDAPKLRDITNAQYDYISDWWEDLESAAESNFTAVDAYIEFDSFIDHWLLEILAMDVDILRASHYFYKDAGGQLQGGPMWDYDRSMGAADVRIDGISEARSWTPNGTSGHSYLSDVYRDLWTMPEVQARLRARWAELRGGIFSDAELDSLIFSMGAEIAEAYNREDARWGSTSGYGSRYGDLNGELGHLRDWVNARTLWLDGQFLNDAAPPQLNLPPGGLEIQANTLVDYQVQATDPQTLVYTATGLPEGLGLDASTGRITGVVAYGDIFGTPVADITVTDSSGAATTGQLAIFDPVFVDAASSSVVLNEYNAVSPGTFLDDGGTDTFFDRVSGNGGDWFELVTVDDNLDMRGWQLDLFSNNDDGDVELTDSLVLGQDSLLADIRAGSIITVAESVPDDLSYDPAADDWTLNLQANTDQDGVLFASQSNFDTNHKKWRLVIRDATGAIRGFVGGETEAFVGATGRNVGSGEVLGLGVDPSATATTYEENTESTFGAPNVLSAGGVQDFGALRPPPPEPVDPGLLLNEWNAVASDNLIAGGDSFFGSVLGNGGDWFELVVVEDHLDVRGWQLILSDSDAGAPEVTDTFVFADDPLLADLRSGTIITVSEDLSDDLSFSPATLDWTINLQAESADGGAFFTAASQSNFDTNNSDWQLRIVDDTGTTRFGPVGEGVAGLSGVGSSEVGQLELDPSDSITPTAGYNDSGASTFGSPNVADGVPQNFAALRSWFVAETDAPVSAIASPLAGAVLTSADVDLSGSTTDETGVAHVDVTVQDVSTGLFLQPDATFGAAETLLPASLDSPDSITTNWSSPVVVPTGSYEVSVAAIDVIGNAETPVRRSFSVDVEELDEEPPSVPTGLTAAATSSTITVSWLASTDNVGVQNYGIYRDGLLVAAIGHPLTEFMDGHLGADTSYNYEIVASDAAGNESERSAPLVASTTPGGPVLQLSDQAAATWQTNGNVRVVLPVGDTIYIGGEFTELNDGNGTTVARTNLAAIDRVTGAATSFNPNINNTVYDMALAPGGSTLYVVGSFTSIDGNNRRRLAAFDLSTGEVNDFKPAFPNGSVRAVATDGTRLYVGGFFDRVGADARSRLAAYNIDDQTVAANWTPAADSTVRSLIADPTRVWVAGNFTSIDGSPAEGLAAVDPIDGSLLATEHPTFPVLDLAARGDQLFVAGAGPGGRAAAYDRITGTQQWSVSANEAVRSVAVLDDFVYFGGSHTRMGGLDVDRLTRLDVVTGTIDDSWLPVVDGLRGVRAVAAAESAIAIGGDFTLVSGDPHQGFALFVESAAGPAGPELQTLTLLDNDQNGFVDTIEAEFDTTLAPCAAPCTDGWLLTDVPSGGTLNAVSTSGTVATLQLTEGTGDADTSVGTLVVELDETSVVQDDDGNQARVRPTVPLDGAAPIPVWIRRTNVGTTGLAESGDSFRTVWSEPLLGESLPTAADVVLTDPTGAGNDIVTIDGLINGDMDLGSDDFLVCPDAGACNDPSQALFANSAVTLSRGGRVTAVTLSTCTGDCDHLGAGPLTTATYVAPPTITDFAGNSAIGSVTRTFKPF